MADLGCTQPLDVRRAMAAGALARGDLMLRPETEDEQPRRPHRQLTIYAHVSEAAVAGIENTRSQVLVAQVESWCATATGPVTLRPVVDLGEHLQVPGYTPSPRLREQVLLTHPTCVFPGCSRPSRGCDLDHVIAFADGGPTCTCNLVPLCRFQPPAGPLVCPAALPTLPGVSTSSTRVAADRYQGAAPRHLRWRRRDPSDS